MKTYRCRFLVKPAISPHAICVNTGLMKVFHVIVGDTPPFQPVTVYVRDCQDNDYLRVYCDVVLASALCSHSSAIVL